MSSRRPLGEANLVTVSTIRAELGCRAELARRIVADLKPYGPKRDRYRWCDVLGHPLVSDAEDEPAPQQRWRTGLPLSSRA